MTHRDRFAILTGTHDPLPYGSCPLESGSFFQRLAKDATMKTLRIDELGHETQFILVETLVSYDAFIGFERRLMDYALGFTRFFGHGGWKGAKETITIYRVASLSNTQRLALIHYLLDNTGMTDLYVVLPGGMAQGYCYEEVGSIVGKFALHGTRRTGWPEA